MSSIDAKVTVHSSKVVGSATSAGGQTAGAGGGGQTTGGRDAPKPPLDPDSVLISAEARALLDAERAEVPHGEANPEPAVT